MAYAKSGQKNVRLDDVFTLVVWSEGTRYGFRHVAVLHRNGGEVCKVSCAYYNRTWESWRYQTVIRKCLNRYFSDAVASKYMDVAEKGGVVGADADLAPLRMLAGLAQAVSLLSDKPEDTLKTKKTAVLSAGCTLPGDFDSLPKEEQLRRLDGALDIMKG